MKNIEIKTKVITNSIVREIRDIAHNHRHPLGRRYRP